MNATPGRASDSPPEISVVVPVYRNADSVRELALRVRNVMEGRGLSYEIVFVDDACPGGSLAALTELAAADPSVTVLSMERNAGQHRAVLAGLRRSRGRRMITMDADLQDPPEAIPRLLDALEGGPAAVFAGRRGRYEGPGRLLTSRLFKRLLHALCGVPADAGMFVAMDRRMADRLLSFRVRNPFVVAMIGCSGLPVASVPVVRSPRLAGGSAYSSWKRFRTGCLAVGWVVARKCGLGARAGPGEHNLRQKLYYERPDKPNLVPADSPYLNRHVDELMRFAGIREGSRVLEVGCGMGRYTLILARRGVAVEGLDLTPCLLDRLREYDGGRYRIPLHCADVSDHAPELDGRFDCVVGFFTLHHLHDLARCFGAMTRLVKPGGRVAFLEPNAFNPLYYVQILMTPGMTWRGDRGIVRMRRGPVFGAMERAGLVRLATERFGFFPPFVSNRPTGARVEAVLERVPLWRALLPFRMFRGDRP